MKEWDWERGQASYREYVQTCIKISGEKVHFASGAGSTPEAAYVVLTKEREKRGYRSFREEVRRRKNLKVLTRVMATRVMNGDVVRAEREVNLSGGEFLSLLIP